MLHNFEELWLTYMILFPRALSFFFFYTDINTVAMIINIIIILKLPTTLTGI